MKGFSLLLVLQELSLNFVIFFWEHVNQAWEHVDVARLVDLPYLLEVFVEFLANTPNIMIFFDEKESMYNIYVFP